MARFKIKRGPQALHSVISVIIIAIICFFGAGCLGYLSRAGSGQFSILWNRRAIEEVIRSPETKVAIRNKLQHVLEVRHFAQQRLHLKLDDSYSTYSEINRPYVAWNVSASRELALEPHTWWFPIVGRVPYLGFFSEQEARLESQKLKKKGWDVLMRPVSAYSTLGWFSDPLLSSQMKYPNWYLTRLIIHEAAHSTIWFPDDVSFNESFASFVEEAGSLEYYRVKYGPHSPAHAQLKRKFRNQKLITGIFRKYAHKLNSMYGLTIPPEDKRRKKNAVIEEMKREFAEKSRGGRIAVFARYARMKYNNAYFLSYLRYSAGGRYFRRIFEGNQRDWSRFLEEIERLKAVKPSERRRLLNPEGAD